MSAPTSFDGRATEADIAACFRLLLGRAPNPEEREGHFSRAGQDLATVVSGYLDSLEFARRRASARAASADPPETATFPGFRILARRDDLAVGADVLKGVYEPEVAAVFRDILRPGMGVLDIGANIGFFTMLAASLVGPQGRVIALEPNPENARMAEASRRLNGYGQVTVVQVAAGRAAGMLAINTSFSNGTTSAISDAIADLQTVACIPADLLALAGPRIDLVKIDVEGAEFNALLGCRQLIARDCPAILFEFSPGQLRGISDIDGEEFLRWIVARGYRLGVLSKAGPPRDFGGDGAAVMRAFEASGTDHIDVLATPPAGRRERAGFWRRTWNRLL